MRRITLLAFLGYLLLGAAWALALPVNGTYDEKQHIVWAWAVLDGQWVSHETVTDASGFPADGFRAPAGLLPTNADCTWFPKNERPKPASCLLTSHDRTETTLPSAAARYSPVYYALVGLPIRVSPDETGIIGSRLLSAALSALLLAAATAIAVRRGNGLLVAAVALVSTPLAMNLNGSLNPNGLEIAAGVLLFVAVSALLRQEGRPPTHLPVLAGVAGALLLTVRNLGPLLFALVLAACLVAAPRGRARAVAADREVRRWFGGLVALGVLLFAGWALLSRQTEVTALDTRAKDWGPVRVLEEILLHGRGEFYVQQIVGQFNYGETTISKAAIALWYLLVAALVVPALWFAGRRLRLAVVGTAVVCAALLYAMEVYFIPIVGPFSQGRYVMPLGVGVVLLAAFADRHPAWLSSRAVLCALVALTVPVHLYALARVMTRFQRGIDVGIDPFGGVWQPAAGPLVPLLACLVGGALLVVTVTRSSVRPTAEHSTVNTISN